MNLPIQVVPKGVNVHQVRHENIGAGFEQWYLLAADMHWDNPKSKQKLIKKHFDEALERNAGIFSFGDLFCAMQGKYDPRGSKKDIRPEHNVNNYLDALVDTASEWFAPYAKNIIVISEGNHETSIKRRCETDLLQRLVTQMNIGNEDHTIYKGGYSGYVWFTFSRENGSRSSKKMWYHHGFGGGGPVTKGVIQTNRRSAFVRDADIIVGGHIHEEWEVTQPTQRLSEQGRVILDEQIHISLPTYKEEYDSGIGGYHIEKGRPPKPLGARWLRFYYDNGDIKFETIRAK